MVTAKGHGRPADWWSVGVLLFEMLTGKHPFSARNRQLLQKKILSEKLKLPPYLTQEAASLLKGLLTRDPKARLGTGEEGIDKVRLASCTHTQHAYIHTYPHRMATTMAHPPLRTRRAHRRTSLSDSSIRHSPALINRADPTAICPLRR